MDKIAELLSGLASKLGTTVEYLWPKLVSYRLGNVIGAEIVTVLVLAIGAVMLARVLSTSKWDENDPLFGRDVIVAIVSGVMTVGGIISFVSTTPAFFAAIMSPEGYTLSWLMSQVGGRR